MCVKIIYIRMCVHRHGVVDIDLVSACIILNACIQQ